VKVVETFALLTSGQEFTSEFIAYIVDKDKFMPNLFIITAFQGIPERDSRDGVTGKGWDGQWTGW